jgi:eukaryotic-like serine/threonine-protein kinase
MAKMKDRTLERVSGPAQQPNADVSTETTHDATNAEKPPRGDLLNPDDVAGEFVIKQKIGWGGCSTVYAAEHRASRERVAVKVMHPGLAESPKQVQRFVQEAQAVRLIQHPTIVEVYDIGRLTDGRPYIVMELLEGTNLAALIQTRGRFSPAEALEILAPIGEALIMAHEAGIVHRDIKASNIVLVDVGDRREVKLLDFGIAKLVHHGNGGMQTTVGHVLGTPHSMAPEQIRGQGIDGRTDIYALGALLYRLLTGKHPFEGCDAITLTKMHMHTQPPPPSQSAPVSPEIDAVVRRAMEKEPDNRYPTVAAFTEALREAVAARPKAEEAARAMAVFIDVRLAAEDENDDDLLDDVMNILDIAEQVLASHQFFMPLKTGNALLGALLVPDPALEGELRIRVMDVAADIEQEIADRPDPADRIEINICLHLAGASVRTTSNRTEIVGGAILDVGDWAPKSAIDRVCATPEALGFAVDEQPRTAHSYVRIGPRRGS